MLHIHEKVPSKMAAIMVTFDAGSKAEGVTHPLGIAHMLEHMLFKGTEKRDCYDIQKDIAILGGRSNAFTSNDMVCYYITVPIENIESATEIISDMVFNSKFPEEEFFKERNVVLEEEADSHGEIEDFIWSNICTEFFSGRERFPNIGTKETIESFTRADLCNFYNEFYTRDNAIVALSSCLSKRESARLLTKYFGRDTKSFNLRDFGTNVVYKDKRLIETTRLLIEHAHVHMCYPGPKINNANEAADSIMLSILGGGANSRLYETVREKNGLCYGIGAYKVSFRDQGCVTIGASTREQNIERLLELSYQEIEKMKSIEVTDYELLSAKNQFRSQTYSLVESCMSSASWITKRAFHGLSNLDEITRQVANLTTRDILESAQRNFEINKELLLIVRPEERI